MQKFIKAWADFVVDRRGVVLILTLLVVVGLVMAMRPSFNNSNEMWFEKGDPVLVDYHHLKDTFTNDEFLVVGIEARGGDKDVFNQETFAMIYEMTDFLVEHNSVELVRSITNLELMEFDGGLLVTDELAEDYQPDYVDVEESLWRELAIKVSKEDMAVGNLISKDLQHTRILARVQRETDENFKVPLTQDFKNFLVEKGYDQQGYDIKLAGAAAINEAFLVMSIKDQSIAWPIMFTVIIAVLLILFRTGAGSMYPFLMVIISVLSIFGVMGLGGYQFNILSINLPLMLIIIALGDSIHVVSVFYSEVGKKKGSVNDGAISKEAIRHTIEHVWMPCFLTTLTTVAGVGALIASHLVPISEFGLLAAIGVVFAFTFSMTTLPSLLTWHKVRPEKAARISESGAIAATVGNLAPFCRANAIPLMLVSVGVFGFSIYYCTTVKVDTNFMEQFLPENKFRQDVEYFDEHYNGTLTLNYVIDSGKDGGALEPEFLKEVAKFQDRLETYPWVGNSLAVPDYLKKIGHVLHENDPEWKRVPDSPEAVAQYLFLYFNTGPTEDLSDLKDFDDRYLHITAPIQIAPSNETRAWIDQMTAEQKEAFPSLNQSATGAIVLFNYMDIYVNSGILNSFLLALIFISVCFVVFFKSIKFGLLSLFPSVLPILFAGGIMGYMGTYLDLASMIIAAMTFGIAVDDTIHVMHRYLEERRAGKSVHESVGITLSEAGRALAFTSIILFFGFSMLMTSQFTPTINMGILGCIIIGSALIGDLLILPAILYLIDREKKSA